MCCFEGYAQLWPKYLNGVPLNNLQSAFYDITGTFIWTDSPDTFLLEMGEIEWRNNVPVLIPNNNVSLQLSVISFSLEKLRTFRVGTSFLLPSNFEKKKKGDYQKIVSTP